MTPPSTPAPDDRPDQGPADQAVSTAGSRARRRWKTLWREWLRPLLVIAVVMFSFRSAVADWNDVPTGSMKPTILEGDRIFINKIAYDLKFPFTTWRLAEWDDPRRGDVVVLRSPDDGKRLVKRVVGIPGDVIEIRGGRLYVNGKQAVFGDLEQEIIDQIDRDLQESYFFANEDLAGVRHPVMIAVGRPERPYGPRQVPDSHFFVMGDNRSNSRDSTFFGPVDRAAILGRATAVALSVDPDRHYMPRWNRFFSRLP